MKKSENKNYYLHYASEEKWQLFYVNRPLKLKSKKTKIFIRYIKFEGNTTTKTEF
jgi:hypothetical protein